MYIGIALILSGLFYSILIGVVYFPKKKVKNLETKIYSILLLVSFISLVLELLCCYYVPIKELYPTISLIINRFFLIAVLSWVTLFSKYIFNISFDNDSKLSLIINNNHKIVLNTFIGFYIICLFFVSILPLTFYYDGTYVYSYGLSTDFLFAVTGFYITFLLVGFLINIKKVSKKKIFPFFAFLFCILMVLIIRALNPGFLLISAMQAFITVLMYHTIENPDVKMIEELNIAKDQADKANSAKTDFLSSMSHEIRTPLNAIVGFSGGLLEEELNEDTKSDVKNIITASNSLLELVNGILDISKIEANKLEIMETNYSFNKIFDDLVILCKARINDKDIDFQYKYDKSIPEYLHGDGNRLKQIILNLLTNSAKYTTTGHIYFNVSSVIENDTIKLIILVEDSGVGIKEENINKLFNKFERLGIERNTTTEGTGLGLAITKKLVELMKGKIFVQSAFSVGSRFTILIDQGIVKGEELEKVKALNNVVSLNNNINLVGKKVLIVDDNLLNLKVAQRLLKKYNLNIECVNSGYICIEKIENNNTYDLILMDDMMPHMSGIETFHKLKENSSFNIPVVVLTANAISGMREKYLEEGFEDYLSKPIEKEELNRVIKKYLS